MTVLYKLAHHVLATGAVFVALYYSFQGQHDRSAMMWACAAYIRIGTLS